MDSGYLELEERPCKKPRLETKQDDFSELLQGLEGADWSDLDYDLDNVPVIQAESDDEELDPALLLLEEEEAPIGSMQGDAEIGVEEEEVYIPATGGSNALSGVVPASQDEDEQYWGQESALEEEGLLLATQEITSSARQPSQQEPDEPPADFESLGFTTGGGQAVKPPSEAALARAQQFLASSQPVNDGFIPSSQLSQSEILLKKPDFANLGFQTGGGKTVSAPSEQSLLRAQQLFAPTSSQAEDLAAPQHSPPVYSRSLANLGFTTAGGKAVSEPSSASRRKAEQLFAPTSSPGFDLPADSPPQHDFSTMFKTAGGGNVQAPSTQARERAERILASPPHEADESMIDSPITNRISRPLPSAPSQSQSKRHPLAQVQNASSPDALALPDRPAIASQTPARPILKRPAIQTNRTITPSPFRPPTRAQSVFSPQPALQPFKAPLLKPTLRPKKINISILPAPSVQLKKKFVPPFKGGVRPTQEKLDELKKSARERDRLLRLEEEQSSQRSSQPGRGPSQRIVKRSGGKGRVFDVSKRERQSMQEYGIEPGQLSPYSLLAIGIPEEVVYIDSVNAGQITFLTSTGAQGWQEATHDLHSRGATLVDDSWVQNHWSLIVWKLGCLIKAKPDELDNWWNYDEVLRQLLYRYEWEINQANRSAVKRMQERDSPAGSPLVLVVSQIFWKEPDQVSASQQPLGLDGLPIIPDGPTVCGFEMSDGWYRIGVKADIVLEHAAKRGKLAVGSKIAITGAKLDVTREASDVLEAANSSVLTISSNSSSLTDWDAKLGFQKQIYVASLRSLSPEGGVATLLDLTIVRIYPIGYSEAGKDPRAVPPWDEKEEVQRQVEYERTRTRAYETALETCQNTVSRLVELAERLAETAGIADLGRISSMDEDTSIDGDDLVDQLQATGERKLAMITLSRPQLISASQSALHQSKVLQETMREDVGREVEELCPSRNIRSFRVVRARDTKASDYGMEAQITVYDVLSMGENALVEGTRYWVTNARPVRTSGWSRHNAKEGEIFLSTNRGSKWIVRAG